MTTMTRRFALYRAQEGAYINDIEQLQASISLPSTIKIVFTLRKFTAGSALLVVVWSFYYLGSQASKREYTYALANRTQTWQMAYPTTTFDIADWSLLDKSITESASRFLVSVAEDYKVLNVQGADSNGYPLLPDPVSSNLLNENGTIKNSSVAKVSPSQQFYASFVGRQPLFAHTDSTGEISWATERFIGEYTLDTSSFLIKCFNPRMLPEDQFPANVLDSFDISINTTNSTTFGQFEVSQRWDGNFSNFYASLSDPPQVAEWTETGVMKLTCDIVNAKIKSKIQCGENACLARTISCPFTEQSQLLTTYFSNSTFTSSFFNALLLSQVPQARNDASSSTQNLLNLDDLIEAFRTGRLYDEQGTGESHISDTAFWYTMAVNSYFNLLVNSIPVVGDTSDPKSYSLTTALGNIYEPHYQLYQEWIAIDYVAGVLLLSAAIFSFWLRKHTLAPDIFGFVSTLTRDNPYFPVPTGGSTLDGLERTRAFGNLKVKIGEIAGPNGMGRVGFVPVHPTFEYRNLMKGRKYV